MGLLAWIDGRVVEASELRLEVPYILQRLHTLDYRVYATGEHIRILREGSERLFGFATLCRVADVERIVPKLLELSNVSRNLSCPVAMRIDALGKLSFEVEASMYNAGYYLRAKRYEATAVVQHMPESVAQTSVSLAVDAMAECQAQCMGGGVALWVDENGMLISRPWNPVFVYHNQCVYTPCEHSSVEYRNVRQAVEKVGYKLIVRDIPYDKLMNIEEIFTADVMCMTSFSGINKHRLLSMAALRIAKKMEPTSK